MKTLIKHTLFTMTILASQVTLAEDEVIYSSVGYPYNQLISRTDAINITYTKDKEKVNCKVEVKWQGKTLTSPAIVANSAKFSNKPLASCLPRETAKSILAKTFH